MQSGRHLNYQVLGPLRVESAEGPVAISSPKQRELLCLLAGQSPSPASRGRVIEALWPESDPKQGKNRLGFHLSKLRDALDADRGDGLRDTIETSPAGYRLTADEDDIDWRRFLALHDRGRKSLRANPLRAERLLNEALGLWQGRVFADCRDAEWAQPQIGSLEEARLVALEDAMDASLGAGRHDAILGTLRSLVGEHPFRDRFRAQLMLALYRSGQPTAALDEFRKLSRLLGEELGLDPSGDMLRLEEQILLHDEALAAPTPMADLRPGRPSQATSFVGRSQELMAVSSQLAESRIVSVVGPGGAGKSRLVDEMLPGEGARYADEPIFIDLAVITDSASIADEVLRQANVPERPGISPLARVIEDLRNRQTLVVFDNCEHLMPDIAVFIASVVRNCPDIRVLATSRTRLKVSGETVLRLDGLPADQAVLLLRERAGIGTVDSDWTDHAKRLCARLDGLPLAIEIAAPYLESQPVASVVDQFDRHLEMLAGQTDLPERQQSLRASLDWSYRLLPDEQRILLRRLSVFAAGFDIDGAGALTERPGDMQALSTLSDLADASLLVRDRETGRHRLPEIVRRYAAEELSESGDEEQTLSLQCRYFTDLTSGAIDPIRRGDEAWLRRIDEELPNLRSVLAAAVARRDRSAVTTLLQALHPYWAGRDLHIDAMRSLDAALPLLMESPDRATADLLAFRTLLAVINGDEVMVKQSLATLERFAAEIGDAAVDHRRQFTLGFWLAHTGELSAAVAAYDAATDVSEPAGWRMGPLVNATNAEIWLGRTEDARRRISLIRDLDDDRSEIYAGDMEAAIAWLEGDVDNAGMLWRLARRRFVETGRAREARQIARWLAIVALHRRDLTAARGLLGSGLMGGHALAHGDDSEAGLVRALLLAYEGDVAAGADALYWSLLSHQSSPVPVDQVLAGLVAATLAAASEEWAVAAFALSWSDAVAKTIGFREPVPHCEDRAQLRSQIGEALPEELIDAERARAELPEPQECLNRVLAWLDQQRAAPGSAAGAS